MKLRLTLRAPGTGASHNIQVTADATATAHDVATALAGALGQQTDEPELTLRVIDPVHGQVRTVGHRTTLVDSAVMSGTLIELSHDGAGLGAQRGAAAALLTVLEGPDKGIEVPLPLGSAQLGRSQSCDVRLTDQRVSKQHARIQVGDRIEVIDNNSSNGVVVAGVRESRVTITGDDVVVVGDTEFRVTPLRTHTDWSTTDIAFVRSPRVLTRPEETEIELPEPPGPLPASRFPWLALVAPLLMGAVLFLLTRNMLSIIFIALSPLLMIGAWATNRLDAKSNQKRALAHFESSLAAVGERVVDLHTDEVNALLALHPSVNECVAAVSRRSDVIWSRRPEHPEYLQIRLGLGEAQSCLKPVVRLGQGLPELATRVVQLAEESTRLPSAPVVADLRKVGALGLCGGREVLDGVARGVVVQLSSLHSPAELVLCCLTSTARKSSWAWVEWLPHTGSPHSPLGRHLAADPAASRALIDQVEELVGVRLAAQGAQRTPRGPGQQDDQLPAPVLPTVVLVVDDPQIDRARLTRIAEIGPDAGVHLIWVADEKDLLPAACRTFLDVGTGSLPTIGQVRLGKVVTDVACESVDPSTAEAIGRRFAPLIDAGAPVDDESDLPRAISVVTLLGQPESDQPEVVVERWRENRSLIARGDTPRQKLDRPVDLRAIVGHSGVEPFVLDLRRDGPHALVGGTTGSGKSEFLQAWVLGLAHALSPDRVNFLFVDYKGGSAFSKCVELPHCVGLVTDLNPYLVRRVLTSLRAELRLRERILNAKGKKDLIDLEVTGDPECPPSLIIVVDEFAALVGEVPEFVEGMVDIAQRGRSLGLHLILATQRPAGVIRDNLRANTNLRIALRMADEQDSADVLGTPMAAFFPPSIPGRAAAKSGPGRIVGFQSAFPGARTSPEPPVPPIEVAELDFGTGRRWAVPERRVVNKEIPKDIERVVGTLARAAEQAGVRKPRRPWLEDMAPVYNLAKLGQRRDTSIVLGVRDDPEHQTQEVEHFRPDEEANIVYLGASGSGKTTGLRSLAIAASITPRSGPVHVFGLDFAGGGLSSLEPLPNVGSIISGDDDERVQRLFRRLMSLLEERSGRFSAVRAATLQEYRDLSGRPDEPRILVLLDGFGAFREQYESAVGKVYQSFTRLIVDGRSVGLHFAMTADRPAGVPTSVNAAFSRRIVLRQADDDAYLMLGLPKDVLGPLSPSGRAMQVGNPQELQLAILGDDVATVAQASRVEELARAISPFHKVQPEPVRALPAVVAAAGLPANVRGLPVLGVADLDLQPVGFEPRGTVLITGPDGCGATSALHWMAQAIRTSGLPVELHHMTPQRSPLSGLSIWRSSATGEDQMIRNAVALRSLVSQPAEGGHAVALFLEGLPDLVSVTAVADPLTDLLQLSRRNGHFVVAEGALQGWTSGWPLTNEVRNARTGLLLAPEQSDGDAVLRTSLPRAKRSEFPSGRGYWVKGGLATKIQVPLME